MTARRLPVRSTLQFLLVGLLCSALAAQQLSITLDPAETAGGFSVTGTVTISPPPILLNGTVQLSSSDPTLASTPASVVVGRGRLGEDFTVTTTAVNESRSVTIRASWNGMDRTAVLKLNPRRITSLVVDPAVLIGGANALATVDLDGPAPPGGWLVNFSSSNLAVATLPQPFGTVPAGESRISFPVRTARVAAPVDVLIGARHGTDSRSVTLRVLPVAVETVSIDPPAVAGGESSTGTVVLNSPAPAGGVLVSLLTSDEGVAVVPPEVLVPGGEESADFVIETRRVEACVEVLVSATYQGTAEAALLVGVAARLSDEPTFAIWNSRDAPVSQGMLLWTEGADAFGGDDIFFHDGAETRLVQALGNLGKVEPAVFALGSGASPGTVIGAWRRGTNDAWVWRSDGGDPVLVIAENPFDPDEPMNPEALGIADGCVFLVLQAFDPSTNLLVKILFKVDASSGAAVNLSGSASVVGVARVASSGCQAAWVYDPDTDPTDEVYPPRELQFHDGSSLHVLDSGDLDFKPSLAAGRIVHEKIVDGVSQVFLIDTNVPGGSPVRLSRAAAARSFAPRTDGRHVAWLEERADGEGVDVVLAGGRVLTVEATRLPEDVKNGEDVLQLQRGQLLWRDAAGALRYASADAIESVCLAPAESVVDAWLIDGSIAWRGPSLGAGPDTDAFLFAGKAPADEIEPPPPLLLAATPGNGQVTLEWDQVLGATSYVLYRAEAPGVTGSTVEGLPGGVRTSGVTSPFTVMGLENGRVYYFAVSAVDESEGPTSREASAMPFPEWARVDGELGEAFVAVAADRAGGPGAFAAAKGPAGNGNRVYRSEDGGIGWTSVGDLAGTPYEVRALAADGQRIHGVFRNGDIVRSTTGGAAFETVFSGGDVGETLKSLAVDPGASSTLYAGDFDPQVPGDSYLVKSTDGGDSWTRLPDFPGGEIRAYAIVVDGAGTVYAGGTGTPSLVTSVDGGAAWSDAALPPSNAVYSLALHPARPGVLYAGTRDNGVYIRTEGGDWVQVNAGFADGVVTIHALLSDPDDPETLYAGTNAGVYSLDLVRGEWTAVHGGMGAPEVYALALTAARRILAGTAAGLFLLELEPPVPPAAPTGLVAEGRDGAVDLDWDDPGAAPPRVAGYEIYRATSAAGPYFRLTEDLVLESRYTDGDVANRVQYCYRVRAVSTSGVTSGDSLVECTIPGLVPMAPVFKRGDSDSSGRVDLADAIRILGFLFLGAPAPRCLDASDADDSGSLNRTDAVFILSGLFPGGAQPPAPGPFSCGPDETPEVPAFPACEAGVGGCAG
ncbi:MAG TPA: hypothetical protein VMT52_16210, partial [Planctomycetota bacterium]|nr:hypothetical protein [Planctomycetota bacterium]